ncbi:DUF2551 domain-containing protein [Methanolobus psychrotolerans]|uniref:DUF2551 domain-containing protein n=1 Tax=Methanolobus psychrotolerans TaxID=1874706 RepID=UPI001F5C6DDC|nr:DUF2551 domain-containing protein [Methanolobus psychrotolerans]
MKKEVFVLETIEERVRERLIKYLSRDDTGIRKVVLKLFLNGGKFTTGDVYEHLHNTDFDVSYRGVSAMVGLMNTRLGILSIDVTGDHNIYLLKEDYRDIVRNVLDNY